MENAMKEYFLVKDYVKNKSIALVRSEYGRATVIAGDKSAEKVFIGGDPYNINMKYGFTLLGHSSCHPDIGYYIDLLGPVADSKQRLEKAKRRAVKTEVAKALSETDLVRISELLSNGVSQRSVAEIMGVSQSFIQRNKPRESPTLSVGLS
jgi:hypothetical protein